MKTQEYFKAELRSIDAWRNCGYGWEWNASYLLEEGIFFADGEITARKVLRFLRKADYLTSGSKGKLFVDDLWPVIEICEKSSGRPILALVFEENEISGRY